MYIDTDKQCIIFEYDYPNLNDVFIQYQTNRLQFDYVDY